MGINSTQAINKMKCAVGIKKGCMLSAEETKALLEDIASWTEVKAAV